MGNWFQIVVDRDVSLNHAQPLAAKVCNWLITQNIIGAEMTDCVLNKNGLGYPPSSNALRIVESPSLDLFQRRDNGLNVVIGRTVFDCGQGGFDLICPYCKSQHLDNRAWQEAVTEWYEARRTGLLKCGNCDRAELVTEWQCDPVMSFGNLGFEFWNWEPLT